MVRCTLYNRTQGCWHKTRQPPKSKVRGTEGFFSPICDVNRLDEIHLVLGSHRYQFCGLYSRLLQLNIDAIWVSNGLFLCENLLNPPFCPIRNTNVQIPTPTHGSLKGTHDSISDLGFDHEMKRWNSSAQIEIHSCTQLTLATSNLNTQTISVHRSASNNFAAITPEVLDEQYRVPGRYYTRGGVNERQGRPSADPIRLRLEIWEHEVRAKMVVEDKM